VDAREQRGLELAATRKFKQKGDLWLVPSASGGGTYVVDPTDGAGSCSCPDYETHGVRCKHLFAVIHTIRRETATDGTVTVTESVTAVKRTTYKQDWPAYNLAATTEKARVAELLHALCSKIPTPPQSGRGQRRLPLSDAIFAAAMKVFLSTSGRRAQSDMADLAQKGFMAKAPCYNSVFNVLASESVTPLLRGLIEESANPLRAVEQDFAADSSGFSTSVFDRWYDEKYGSQASKPAQRHRKFLKAHVMVGVKTHAVVSVEITNGDAHDSPYLPTLLASTAPRFLMREVSADKGYLSHDNLAEIVKHGAEPFIPFKSNSKDSAKDALWHRLFHLFQFEREKFNAQYHKRSNVETVFSMVKAKFGNSVRSKTDTAQKNEILLKLLCHNLCRLVAAIYELGVDPVFWPETGSEPPRLEAAS
jgi:transposase